MSSVGVITVELEILHSLVGMNWDPNPIQDMMQFYLTILEPTSILLLRACPITVVLCLN